MIRNGHLRVEICPHESEEGLFTWDITVWNPDSEDYISFSSGYARSRQDCLEPIQPEMLRVINDVLDPGDET